MKKMIQPGILFLFLLLVTGCSHKAAALQENGVWEERNLAFVHDPENFEEEEVDLSIQVNQEMTENDMLSVLDYYENEVFPEMQVEGSVDFGGKMVEVQKRKITMCYVVFYKGETDEVLKEIKYINGQSVPAEKEDADHFTRLKMRDRTEDESTDE